MNNLKIIFCFILIISVFQSCFLDEKHNCPSQKTLTQYIGDGYKKQIPYTGFDTLTFVRTSVGDTHTFYGTGINTGFDLGSYNSDINCPDDKTQLEHTIIKFVSPTFPDPIYYHIYFRKYNESEILLINFRNQDFYDGFDVILGNSVKYDSLIIGNNLYYKIHLINNINHYSSPEYYLYYNSFGMLKFKFINNETWELVSK